MKILLLVALAVLNVDGGKIEAYLSSSIASEFIGKHPSPFSPTFFNVLEEEFKLKDQSIYHRRLDVKKKDRAHPDLKHDVVFAVKHNYDELKLHVEDVANPYSANYGQHLTKSEVHDMTYNDDSYQHILTYLHLHEVEVLTTSTYFDFITASAPISKWEELFSTQFYEFDMDSESDPLIRSDQYSLPVNLHDHVSTVFNTVQFPLPKLTSQENVEMPQTSPIGAILNGFVTPALLNQVYGIKNNTGGLGSQAVYETANEHYSPSDLTLFQQTFNLPVETVATDIGGHAFDGCSQNCGESNLDLQYLMAVSQGTPTTYYWTGSNLYDWLMHVSNMATPPRVISISWGGPESWMLVSDVVAFNQQAMKLAAMGVSLITSSGDDGAPGSISRNGPMYCGYHAEFPSISEYVTSVGATMGPETDNAEEVVCQSDRRGLITSGGGFSDFFPTPSWQSNEINSYLSRSDNLTGGFNGGGRAYPDVSLLGRSYVVAVDGTFVVESGTSASSPVFAGMIALINSKRLALGKSTLGWLNPTLYALQKSFIRDITEGHNHCNVKNQVCCAQGFHALKGWDPVSGLGSINYPQLEAALLNLGGPPITTPSPSPIVIPVAPNEPPASSTSGWLYGTYYSGENCEGEVRLVEALKVGTCFLGFVRGAPRALLQAVYFKYSCDRDNGYVSIYSDNTCTNIALSLSMPLTCAYDVHMALGGSSSYQLRCSESDTRPLGDSDSFIVESSFDFGKTTECSADSEVFFGAYRNNFCYPVYGGLNNQSFILQYPVVKVCASMDCTGFCTEFQVGDNCLPMFKSDDQDYLYSPQHLERYVRWSLFPELGSLGQTIGTSNSSSESFSLGAAFLLVGSVALVVGLAMFAVPKLRRRVMFSDNPYTSVEMVELA